MSNILLLSSEFPPGPGGIGNHAYCLALNLQANRKYSVKVITPVRTSVDHVFDNKLSFEINRVNISYKIYGLFIGLLKIFLALIDKKHSLIICSGSWALILIGLIKPIFPSSKLINMAHGYDINPINNYKRYFVNIAMNYCDHIIAVSNFTAAHIEKNVWNFQLMGEKGGANWDPAQLYTDDNGYMINSEPGWLPRNQDFGSIFGLKMRNFVDHTLYDKPTMAPAEHGLMVQKMLNGIYESAERGKEVLIK